MTVPIRGQRVELARATIGAVAVPEVYPMNFPLGHGSAFLAVEVHGIPMGHAPHVRAACSIEDSHDG